MPEVKIPHIIHYCWFGKQPKPKLIQRCIVSWQTYMPGWEIREWNESNYDVDTIPYTQSAYRQKKWAFVADYARFDILSQYGGVFLDTDVEFIRTLPDQFLTLDAFTGFEMKGSVAPGLIFASICHHPFVDELIQIYQKTIFYDDMSKNETIVDITTRALKSHGMTDVDTIQDTAGVTIYPIRYFCGFNHITHLYMIDQDTICFHHYAASWVPAGQRRLNRIKSFVIRALAITLGSKRYMALKERLKCCLKSSNAR